MTDTDIVLAERTAQLWWALWALKWIEGYTGEGGNDSKKILIKAHEALKRIGPIQGWDTP